MTAGGALRLDLADFDAVGVASELVVTLRAHALEHETDAAATLSAPPGWYHVVVTARRSGHVVLGIRYTEMSTSRWVNVAGALTTREWQLDEDSEGAVRTYPPGTDASTVAFELLAVAPLAGAPADVRTVTAVDGKGRAVPLR